MPDWRFTSGRSAAANRRRHPQAPVGRWEKPPDELDARSPLLIGGERDGAGFGPDATLGHWPYIRPGARTDAACTVVLAAVGEVRAPEPLREARRIAPMRPRESWMTGRDTAIHRCLSGNPSDRAAGCPIRDGEPDEFRRLGVVIYRYLGYFGSAGS
jgi:hypothetical protein